MWIQVFSNCQKVLMALSTISGSFTLSLLIRRDGDYSGKCIFPVSFFLLCSVLFLSYQFCYEYTIMLFLSLFYDFIQDFAIFNIQYSCLDHYCCCCIYIDTSWVCKIFLFLVIYPLSYFSCIFVFSWKTNFIDIYKKYKNDLNLLLVSLFLQINSHIPFF
jgi:hypothetical protein